jgi:hypothetical protein
MDEQKRAGGEQMSQDQGAQVILMSDFVARRRA